MYMFVAFLEPLRHVPLPRLEPFLNYRVETSSTTQCDRQGVIHVLASLLVRVCVASLAATSRARDASVRLGVRRGACFYASSRRHGAGVCGACAAALAAASRGRGAAVRVCRCLVFFVA